MHSIKAFRGVLLLLFFSLNSLQLSAQFAPESDPHRGLYIDYFFKTRINSSSTIDPAFSILGVDENRDGIFEKEDEILQYAAESHITYLALYDIGKVLGQNLYAWNQNTLQMEKIEKHLCRFIAKAKKQYGITEIGAISSSSSGFDSIRTFMDRYPVTAPYRLRPDFKNSNFFDSSLYVVERTLQPGDKDAEFAEQAKFLLRAADFNSCEDCEADIDVINLEYEFWGACPSDFANFRTRMFTMNNVRNYYNTNHPDNPMRTETYLAFLTYCTSSMPVSELVGTMDGCTNCSPCTGCSNPHPRMVDRYLLAYQTGSATWWPVGEINMFELSTSADSTDIHPLLYSESKTLGGGVDFLGPWLLQSPYNSMYYVEELFYDSWRNNTSTPWGTPGQNNVQAGGVQWFAQSYMVRPLKNPKLFSATSPICSGNGASISFEYYGPAEHGYPFQFYITRNSDQAVVYPPSGIPVSDTARVFIPSGPGVLKTKPVNFRDTTLFPPCVLPNGDYTAYLKLTFNSDQGLSYTSTLPIVVDSRPRIIISGDTSFCEGGQTYLEGPAGAGSYQWYKNGELIGGATGRIFIAKERGYYHLVTAGGSTCAGASDSVQIHVKPLAPVYINSICNGNGTVTLRTNLLPAPVAAPEGGHIYQWNNGATTPEITVSPSSSSVSYRVVVTNPYSGCSFFAKHSVPSSPSVGYTTSITVNSQPSGPCNRDGSISLNVNPNPGWNQMHIMWSNGERTPTISNLAPGTYKVAVFNWNTACTAYDSITIGTLPLNPPAVTPVINQASCTNSDDGSILLNISGGIPPFRFDWKNIPDDGLHHPFQKNQNGLYSGTYNLEIRDSNGCTYYHQFVVGKAHSSPILSVTTTTAAGPCKYSSNGAATVSASGGTSPYTYSWNDPSSQSGATATGLRPGTYTVEVRDQFSCSSTVLVSVPATQVPIEVHLLDSSVLFLNCLMQDSGSLFTCVHGGLKPYSIISNYPWMEDSGHVYLTGLNAGNYDLIVSDANGCMDTSLHIIDSAPLPVITLQTTPATCISCPNGEIYIQVQSGTPPYLINWSPVSGSLSGDTISGLPAGVYEVCIQDAAFCEFCVTDTITEPGIGIQSNGNNDSQIRLFPNPNSGTLFIQSEKELPSKLELYDPLSKQILVRKLNGKTASLSFEALPEGFYWVKLYNADRVNTYRILYLKSQ